MNRTLLIVSVLITGAALGAGGVYVALNWDKLNPFRKIDPQNTAKEAIAQLHKACAGDTALAGVVLSSAQIKNGKLTLHGLVARQEQIVLVEAKGQTLIEQSSDLRAQCTAGLTVEGLKVVPIQDKLASLFQPPDANNVPDRQLLRMTRLDSVAFGEEGKVTFTGVCIRGKSDPTASSAMLVSLLKARLAALGATPEAMPEIAVDVQYYASPAGTLQTRLSEVAAAKGVRITSAWYDDKGGLHVAGILPRADQRGIVDDALSAFAKDSASLVAAGKITPHLAIFDAESRGADLQKQWIEHARKENKPYLRRVLLQQITPTTLENDKKQLVADDEGNAIHFFKVAGRLFDTAGERVHIEKELTTWLAAQLPSVMNATFQPIAPHLAFDVRENPVFALQERIVQRGLDGAAFADALFDEQGKLELTGRLHQPDDAGKQAVAAVVAEALGKDFSVNLVPMLPHESMQETRPIAWKDVVRQTQTKLAADRGTGSRIRIDRLYFKHEDQHLRLICDGAFLHDGASANLDPILAGAIDAIVSSRGSAGLRTVSLQRVRNPLNDLQNVVSEQPSLDGVLFTGLRYGPDAQLHVDGYLGQSDHKAALTALLATRLEPVANLLKPASDAKSAPGWSIDGMKVHPSAQPGFRWSDLVRAGQADLANAPEAFLRRTHFSRAYFKYAEPRLGDKDTKRRLLLHGNVAYLAKPTQTAQEVACKARIEQKLADLGKRMLADVAIDRIHAHVAETESPVFEWQKQALAKDWDGLLFREAYYNRDGKLTIDGYHAGPEQLKHAKTLIDQRLADADGKSIAPAGLAPLDGMKFVPWPLLLDDVRLQFSQAKTSLHKQTRLDRAYFQFDKVSGKPTLYCKGICIYHGKVLTPEQQAASLAEKLTSPLKANGVEDIDIDLSGIMRAANPAAELQKKVANGTLDGVLFSDIGFDAKRVCYIRVLNIPAGQEPAIRQLLDEYAKMHPHLDPIRQQ